MRPPRSRVKAPREYDASGRRRRAEERRSATLDAAQELFLRHGYAATTVATIAEAAHISPATVYKSYGGKTGVLRSLCLRALAGVGTVPAERRSEALRGTSDPRQLIEGWGRLVAEVSPRISPLLMVLHDVAASDDEARNLRDELEAARLERMADNARSLASAGPLRTGLTEDEVRDILWVASSPELYDLLVRRRRWSVASYSGHVTAMMAATLLP